MASHGSRAVSLDVVGFAAAAVACPTVPRIAGIAGAPHLQPHRVDSNVSSSSLLDSSDDEDDDAVVTTAGDGMLFRAAVLGPLSPLATAQSARAGPAVAVPPPSVPLLARQVTDPVTDVVMGAEADSWVRSHVMAISSGKHPAAADIAPPLMCRQITDYSEEGMSSPQPMLMRQVTPNVADGGSKVLAGCDYPSLDSKPGLSSKPSCPNTPLFQRQVTPQAPDDISGCGSAPFQGSASFVPRLHRQLTDHSGEASAKPRFTRQVTPQFSDVGAPVTSSVPMLRRQLTDHTSEEAVEGSCAHATLLESAPVPLVRQVTPLASEHSAVPLGGMALRPRLARQITPQEAPETGAVAVWGPSGAPLFSSSTPAATSMPPPPTH